MKDFSFGDTIYRFRTARHMSQSELGKLLGVSDKAVSSWENSVAKPRANLLPQLAKVLGVTVGVLMGEEMPHIEISEKVPSGYIVVSKPEKNGVADMTKINFIPEKGSYTGNYICTWIMQEAVAKHLDIAGEDVPTRQRNALNESTLFVESFYHPLEKKYRGDLLFLLDDGWDVPYDTANNKENAALFGSLEPDAEKFRSLGDTPLERLTEIGRRIKALGYQGLGLWVSPNYGEEPFSMDTARAYWEEKARISHAAGVLYWKVDWGKNSGRTGYREMMTECVRKYAPGLMIEHARELLPFSDLGSNGGAAVRDMCERFLVGDVFRTYDVEPPFADTETYARVNSLMKNARFDEMRLNGRGLINVESQPLVAAGLGFTLGIMKHTPAVEAVVRWQRIAPPYGAHIGTYLTSEESVTDYLIFDSDPVWWRHLQWERYSVTVPQAAARNARLAKTECDGAKPIVLTAGHPDRDVLSIVTLGRTIDPNPEMIALADVTAYPKSRKTIVGVFGYYHTLSLEYSDPIPENTSVWAQCMLDDYAENITDLVNIHGSTLTIDGVLLRKLGHKSGDRVTGGEPTVIIKLG